MPAVTDVTFLFLMQVGLILGFLTGYPMVRLLVARGVKASHELLPLQASLVRHARRVRGRDSPGGLWR